MIILLVDDDDNFRTPVSRILQKEGFTVIEARDGAEGYKIVSEIGAKIDLLLTDLTMPRMDGLALSQLVTTLYPNMPVLLMTGNTLDVQKLMSGYMVLHKPIRWRILVQAIRDSILESAVQAAEKSQTDSSEERGATPSRLELDRALTSESTSDKEQQLENQTRKIEIFSAGCCCCEDMIRSIRAAADPSCEITVLDMRQSDVAQRAKHLGVQFVPAVAVNGALVEMKQGAGLIGLRAARLGAPPS